MRDENGRFLKGHSGNPNGRPKKGQTLTDLLAQYSSKTVQFKGQKVARKRVLIAKVWDMAIKGNMEAIKFIFDRIDGPTVSKLDLTSGGEPLVLTFKES